MTIQGYQHKDLFWNSCQAAQYSSDVFNMAYGPLGLYYGPDSTM